MPRFRGSCRSLAKDKNATENGDAEDTLAALDKCSGTLIPNERVNDARRWQIMRKLVVRKHYHGASFVLFATCIGLMMIISTIATPR